MTVAPIAVVVTVRDEAASIAELLQSLGAQAVQPAEIVVVDGGSTDGTLRILESWTRTLPLRVLARPGVNIATGRNIGIEAAGQELIAVTDAGVRLAPRWLERLYAAVGSPDVDVASGFFAPDPRTWFELAMGSTVLPSSGEIDQATFLPSSRSIAFRRDAWRLVGGYPEWLGYCEDVVFDLRLRASGARFRFVPDAIAHFRPRGTLRSFWLQYYRYARGDGQAGLFAKRHALRYCAYLGAVWFLWRGYRYATVRPVLLVAGAGYLWRPYWRLLRHRGWRRARGWFGAAALVPVIRLVGDLAKMAGYPAGLAWRARRYGLQCDWRTIGVAASPCHERPD